ncbi:MAG: hypothetical protein JXB48_06685 [Candidatus Latescibacteria bacterium]|nr:hypothetical protein [Candidatus Latescibacterota bacterium]
MKRLYVYFLLIILFCPGFLFGEGTWSVFPAPSANFIYDHNGYIWVGSTNILYQYDLKNEEWNPKYNFNYIYVLFQASDETIWVGNRGGVSSIQGDTVINYIIGDGEKSERYWLITEAPDGTIWVGATGGISSFDGSSWIFIGRDQGYPFSQCSGIVCDLEGGVWVTAHSYGAARYYNNEWTKKVDLILKKVYKPYISPDGAIWISADDGAICFKDGLWNEYSEKEGLHVDRVSGYYFPENGNVWLGTSEGIFIFDGVSFNLFSEDIETRYRYASNFQNGEDSELWMSTNRGIVIYNPDVQPLTIQQPSETEYVERYETVTFTWDEYPGATSYEIEFSLDGIFMNPETFSLDTNTFSQDINSSYPISSPYFWRVRPLFQDNGGYWSNPRYIYTIKEIPDIFSPDNNLYVESMDNITFKWRSIPDISFYELAISEDVNFSGCEIYSVTDTTYILNVDKINMNMESHYWCVRAIYEEKPGDWSVVRTFYTHTTGAWEKYARDRMILIDTKYHDGTIWLCTEMGLYRYDTTINELNEVPLDGTLSRTGLTSLAVGNDGTIWVGSTTGLCRYDGSGWEMIIKDNGLSYYNIRAVDIDSSGNVWCVSETALNKFDGDSWISYDLPTVTEINSMKVTPSGDIWVGSDGWVGMFSDGIWKKITSDISNVNDIECSQEGSVWIGSECSNYLAKYTKGKLEFYDPNSRRLSLKPVIDSLHKAGYTRVEDSFYVLQGDSTKYIRSVTVRDDGVVFNGIRYGISYFDGQDWILIPSQNILIPAGYSADFYWKFENISGIAVCGNNRTWGIFDNGVICELIDGYFEYRTMLSTLPTDYIRVIEFDVKNTLWLGTINMGVLKYDGSEWINISLADGLPFLDIQHMRTGLADDIWVARTSGEYHKTGYLSYIQGDDVVENYDFLDTQFTCLSILPDRTLYGGTSDKGIITIKDDTVETITTEKGLLSNSIFDIEASQSGEI